VKHPAMTPLSWSQCNPVLNKKRLREMKFSMALYTHLGEFLLF